MENTAKSKRLTKDDIPCALIDQEMLDKVIGMVGDKWSLRVIGALATEDHARARFSALERKIEGISQRMLSSTLRNLERHGLLSRTAYPEVPPRVEYELTELGHSFTWPIKGLIDWVVSNARAMQAAQSRYGDAGDRPRD